MMICILNGQFIRWIQLYVDATVVAVRSKDLFGTKRKKNIDMAYMYATSFFFICFSVLSVCTHASKSAICPNNKAINVHSESGDGVRRVICTFRFPPGELHYYQWILWPSHTMIFYHKTSEKINHIIPKYKNIVVNETHSFDGGVCISKLLINGSNFNPDFALTCKAVLLNHRYCTADTTGLQGVCPQEGSVKIEQRALASTLEGVVTLTCQFRVPDYQMNYYSWSFVGNPRPIYRYPADNRAERHELDPTGGISILTLKYNVNVDVVCMVVLLDGNHCSSRYSIQFQAICPDNKAIKVHSENDDGLRWVTCTFHFPPGQLYYYQWLLWPSHQLICFYEASPNRRTIVSNYKHIVINETHSSFDSGVGYSTLEINSSSFNPDVALMCKVVLQNHKYCTADTTGLQGVCPNNDSVMIEQSALASIPEGTVTLTCQFRVQLDQLHHYSWSIGGNSIYTYPSVDQAERHDLDPTGGKSILTLMVNIEKDVEVVCRVVLFGEGNCSHRHSIQFEDPVIDIIIASRDDSSNKGLAHTVGCIIDGVAETPTVQFIWDGNPVKHQEIYHVEGYDFKYEAYAKISADKLGTLTCKFADKRGNYSLSRKLLPAECPSDNAVYVDQSALAPRTAGLVNLWCFFRVPFGKLSRYEWLDKDNRQLFAYHVFHYVLSENPPSSDVIKKEEHELYMYGGKSTYAVKANIHNSTTFTCRITLTDSTTCRNTLRVRFEDPLISNYVFGRLKYDHHHEDQDLTYVCTVTNSAGVPQISAIYNTTEEHPNQIVYPNDANPEHGIYHQGMLLVNVSHQSGPIRYEVTDMLGSYSRTMIVPQTACLSRLMEIKQNVALRKDQGSVELSCHMISSERSPPQPVWIAAAKEYKGLPWQVVGRTGGYEVISTLQLNITYHDLPIVLCYVKFDNGESCVTQHFIRLFQPSLHSTNTNSSTKSVLAWIPILGVVVLIVVSFCMLTLRKIRPAPEPTLKHVKGTYQSILDEHEMTRRIYEDPSFPAEHTSLGGDMEAFELLASHPGPSNIKWCRPRDMCQDPTLFSGEEPHIEDIEQGYLRDEWFLASLAAVVKNRKFRMDPKQDISKNGVGVVRVEMWRFGKWTDIIIDDRLPVMDSELIFARSPRKNIFWVSLVEKAFAKVYRSYKELERVGVDLNIMVDLTGGVVLHRNTGLNKPKNQKLDESDWDDDVYHHMGSAIKNQYPMTCSTPECRFRRTNTESPSVGAWHLLTITDVKHGPSGIEIWVLSHTRCICMRDILNPQNGVHVGRFSKSSFEETFDQVQICHTVEEASEDETPNVKIWQDKLFGFGRNKPSSEFTTSLPQYQIKCTCEDGTDMVIGILQKNIPTLTSLMLHYYGLRVSIYEVGERDVDQPMTNQDIKNPKTTLIAEFSRYKSHREQGGLVKIRSGNTYVAIISPYFENQQSSFLLRVFADSSKYNLKRLGDDSMFEEIVDQNTYPYNFKDVRQNFEKGLR